MKKFWQPGETLSYPSVICPLVCTAGLSDPRLVGIMLLDTDAPVMNRYKRQCKCKRQNAIEDLSFYSQCDFTWKCRYHSRPAVCWSRASQSPAPILESQSAVYRNWPHLSVTQTKSHRISTRKTQTPSATHRCMRIFVSEQTGKDSCACGAERMTGDCDSKCAFLPLWQLLELWSH